MDRCPIHSSRIHSTGNVLLENSFCTGNVSAGRNISSRITAGDAGDFPGTGHSCPKQLLGHYGHYGRVTRVFTYLLTYLLLQPKPSQPIHSMAYLVSIRAKMIGGGRPFYVKIWRIPSHTLQNADFQSIFARNT